MFQDAPRDNPLDPKNPNFKSACTECIVSDGLVAWWKFDGNLDDEKGAYSSVGSGQYNYNDRYGSNNKVFSGSGSVVTLSGTNSTIFGNAPLTLEFWAYFTTLPEAVDLVSRYGSGGYKIAFGSSKFSGCLGGDCDESSTTVAVSTWYHIALVINSIAPHALYVGTFGSPLAPTNITLSYGPYPTSLTLNFNTTNLVIDDLRFYNRALSPAELNHNHNVSQENNRLP